MAHGKAICYYHGSYKYFSKKNGSVSIKFDSGEGFLIVTSANFSKAYMGENIETGVLLKNKVSLESFIVEFEKFKGDKKILDVNKYRNVYEVFSDGYILFNSSANDDFRTLNSITSFRLPLRKNNYTEQLFESIGGEITDSNLSLSLDEKKCGYLNIVEFDKSFSKAKSAFVKYSIKTPFGYWISKQVYDSIKKSYEVSFEGYKNEIRRVLTPDFIDITYSEILSSVKNSPEILNYLEDNPVELEKKFKKWTKDVKDRISNDLLLESLFFGFDSFDFPIDRGFTEIFDNFLLKIKEINKLKKKSSHNLKELNELLFNNKSDFTSLDSVIRNLKIQIKNELNTNQNHQLKLKTLKNC